MFLHGVGVSCRNLYSFVVNLYVSGSGSITSVGGRESYVGHPINRGNYSAFCKPYTLV